MRNVVVVNAYFNEEEPSSVIKRNEEIINLIASLDMFPLSIYEQCIREVSKQTYIGKGKVAEIIDTLNRFEKSISAVVFNFDLTPLQYRNLSDALEIDIYDRTSIILEIFSSRAKTKEAKLQVEIAQLEYQRTRMVFSEANYSQDTASGGGFTSTRGAGEKKIDLDRRKYRAYQKEKEKELALVVKQRKTARVRRQKSNLPIVAIVGYTNAGKSTLLNKLLDYSKRDVDKKVLQEDRLFATLETSTRTISSTSYPSFIATDTVGFIDNLPISLIKAFRSTLEEVAEADLLVQVVDVSSLDYKEDIATTEGVLKELNATDVPMIYLYNKYDLVKTNLFIPNENSLFTSLTTEDDLSSILDLIFSKISLNWTNIQLLLPYEESLFNFKKVCLVSSIKETDIGYEIKGRISPANLTKYKKYLL